MVDKCCVFVFASCVQDSWRLADLSQKIQVPASVVRKKIAYWQAQGLIEETSNDNFTLIENIEQHTRQESGNQFDDLVFEMHLNPIKMNDIQIKWTMTRMKVPWHRRMISEKKSCKYFGRILLAC